MNSYAKKENTQLKIRVSLNDNCTIQLREQKKIPVSNISSDVTYM